VTGLLRGEVIVLHCFWHKADSDCRASNSDAIKEALPTLTAKEFRIFYRFAGGHLPHKL